MKRMEYRNTSPTNYFISMCTIAVKSNNSVTHLDLFIGGVCQFSSNIIASMLTSVWTFDCHQAEEGQLQQPEQTQNQHSPKSSLTSVWSVLLRHFSPTPSIIFSHKKEQYEWVSDSLRFLGKWLPMLVTQIKNLTQTSRRRLLPPFLWLWISLLMA